MRHLEGVVELPNAVFVAEDVLGASFDCKAGDVTFTLAFPHAPADAEAVSSALGQPYPVDDVVLSDENARGVWSWGYASNSKRMPDGQEQAVAWMIEQLAIKITFDNEDADAAFHALADEFGKAFNVWYQIVLDWTELWRGSILSREDPLREPRGQVRDMAQPAPEGLTGWGLNLSSAHLQYSENTLDRGSLTMAFAKADRKQPPPVQWGLFLRANREPDYRVAVIEAATAAEVALAGALDVRLSDVAAATRELILKNANGLVGLLKLLESIDGVTQSERLSKRVADQLAGPRNDAVHRGSTPTNPQLAFSTARAVLDHYSPLPHPR